MRVVITGGLGFIGVNLIKYLLSKKQIKNIIVVDSFQNTDLKNISEITKFKYFENSKKYKKSNHKVVIIKANVLNSKFAEIITKKNDIIVHLAAESGVDISITKPKDSFKNNVVGAFNYLDAGRKNGIERFIFASSGAVFGNSKPPLTEKSFKGAISPYGSSKLTIESYCETFSNVFDIKCTVLRFSNCYGKYSKHKTSVISKFIKNINNQKTNYIYGNGKQTRDFIYVDDLVEAIYKSFFDNNKFSDFNISTGIETSINSLIEIFNKVYKKNYREIYIKYLDERPGDMKKNYSIPKKITQILKWKPKTKLSDGIEKTVKWYISGK